VRKGEGNKERVAYFWLQKSTTLFDCKKGERGEGLREKKTVISDQLALRSQIGEAWVVSGRKYSGQMG